MRRLATLGFAMAAAALTAAGQLTITTNSLPTAVLGQPYSNVTLQTSGDPGPINWSIDGPFNFTVQSVTATTGVFCYASCSGVSVQQPPSPGTYPITITASSQTTSRTAFANFTLVVEFPLQIVTTSLPNANANQAYSTQLVGFGGTGQYVWSILNGTLPFGIGLDAFKGVLAGNAPGVNGVYPFTVQLLDQVTKEKVTQPLSITIINGVAILTTSLPNATLNQSYSFQLQGAGPNLIWSIPQGSQFPSGFNLSSNGLITGVGTALGSVSLPVQLANGQSDGGGAATRVFPLLVTLGQLSIVEQALPSATQNVPYSFNLTPSGGIPPYSWGLGVSNHPGISINSTTGAMSGTPTQAGSFTLAVTLQDSTGASVSQNYNLNVGNSVTITTTSLPNGSPNVPYSATLTAAAGQLTYTWSISTGSLPPGLTLHASSGVIDGTPTTQGAYQFTAQVKDFSGSIATKVLIITIGTTQVLTITTTLPGASLGQPYSQLLAATGGVQPVTGWTLSAGTLPTGLTLNQSTGAITGTPTALGSFPFTVQALDSLQQTASKRFTVTVATPVTISAANFTATVGVAVSQTVTAAGGVPPYAFSVPTGSLPGGLQIDPATGVISGTPNTAGPFQAFLQATDADGRSAKASITITINSLPVVIGGPSSSGSGQQPGINVSIAGPTTGDINGTLALTFSSAAGGTDDMVRFSNGSRSIGFTIPQGSTTSPNATVITGTVAGTITLTASVIGSADVVKTIVIAPSVPIISSVTLQQVTGGLNVVVTGYSNLRAVSSGSFTFTVASGNTLSQAQITVPLTSAYAAWFGSTSSNATGGQFKLNVPFSVTQGSASAVTKVTVTLTNQQGDSAAVSSQ